MELALLPPIIIAIAEQGVNAGTHASRLKRLESA